MSSTRQKGIIAAFIFIAMAMTSGNVIAETLGNLYGEDFTLRLKSGKEMKLSELSGKPAVIFFYNSRCGCSSHRRLMNKAYLSYKDKGLQMIGVGVRENPNKFFRFAEKEGFSFTSGFDATREIEKNCDVYRLPLTLFISRDGHIVKRAKGYLKEMNIREEIEKLIS